jgi:hypothetical protein
LNSILIEGNLVKAPELSCPPKGTAVCKFTVACNRFYKQEEEMQKEVSFFEVSTWTRLAEVCGGVTARGPRGARGRPAYAGPLDGRKGRAARIPSAQDPSAPVPSPAFAGGAHELQVRLCNRRDGVLGAAYGFLVVVVSSEDSALLLGAIGFFLLPGTVCS